MPKTEAPATTVTDPISKFATELASEHADPRARELLEEMLEDCAGLVTDGTRVADLKLVTASIAEIRSALQCFRTRSSMRRVTVFGSARTSKDDPAYKLARRFGRRIAEAGNMIITGAGPGIMAAAPEGAGRKRTFGVSIQLPFEEGSNPIIRGDRKLAHFKYFFTRKLFFLKEASAVVVFPGGFGTHDEAFECLTLVQTGKAQMMPIVFVEVPGTNYWRAWENYLHEHLFETGMVSEHDRSLFTITDSVDEAVEEIANFYSVFHSSRYLRRRMVLRLNHEVDAAVVAKLSEEFRDLVGEKGIQSAEAYKEESDEPQLADLPRLSFRFDMRSHGRFRQMINRLNELG